MAKNKLRRFEDIERFENVIECVDFKKERHEQKGKWHTAVFKNNNPIVLELACGKGEYTVGMARRDPSKNFVGVDIKGSRIWVGARQALDEGLKNVRFLRTYVDFIDRYFEKNEADEIWIIFPDPYPRKSKSRKRLTSPKFLDLYRKISKPGTTINLKTDSNLLYNYTKEIIHEQGLTLLRDIDNVYQKCADDPLLTGIQTFYEKKHLEKGKIIKFLSFSLFTKE